MLRSRHQIAIALALGVCLCAAPSATGNRVEVEFVKPVSGATPFVGGCGVPGDETRSSEAEPQIRARVRVLALR